MPVPGASDDEMSLREIARTLSDFRQEFRSQISQLLRADVYRAEQNALEMRIKTLEKDHDTNESYAAANRRLALAALFSVGATVLAALVLIALGH